MAPQGDSTNAIIRADGNYFGAVHRRVVLHGLHMSETSYAANARIPSHRHECPSFFMPLGGQGTFVEGCAGTVRRYVAGDVSYHPPYESHWLETHNAPARGFAVEVAPDWRTALGASTNWDTLPRDLSRANVAWTMSRLYHELHIHDSARPLVVDALGVEMGLALSEATRTTPTRVPAWLSAVRETLHDAGATTPSLTELGAIAGVSAVSIIKAFRRHEGCTPGTYLRRLRLAAARRALAGTSQPLSAVAVDAGFYDQSHFTRAFTAAAGLSPQAYRRALHD